MTNDNQVKFDEPGMGYNRIPHGPKESWLVTFVIKIGLAKNAKQASIVLAVVGVLAVILTIIIWPR